MNTHTQVTTVMSKPNQASHVTDRQAELVEGGDNCYSNSAPMVINDQYFSTHEQTKQGGGTSIPTVANSCIKVVLYLGTS